jgi:hypothetical protein
MSLQSIDKEKPRVNFLKLRSQFYRHWLHPTNRILNFTAIISKMQRSTCKKNHPYTTIDPAVK